MRIISGSFGGRKILAPKDSSIRPTSDKIRGSIFNALGSRADIQDAVVLDLCSGTGALGLEALSRGAEHCVFSDMSKQSLALTKQNAEEFDVIHRCDFVLSDACKLKNGTGVKADIFFCDPPYKLGLIPAVMLNLIEQGFLASGAIGVLESEKSWAFTGQDGFDIVKEKTYGDTRLTFVEYIG